MTRLALVLVVCSPCAILLADDRKKPPVELEGAWQESVLPGEDVGVRYRITFTGDKVTIVHRKQVLTGMVWIDATSDNVGIAMVITSVDGEGALTKGVYSGIYQVEKDCVALRFSPHPVGVGDLPDSHEERMAIFRTLLLENIRSRTTLGLAPVTLTLQKVRK